MRYKIRMCLLISLSQNSFQNFCQFHMAHIPKEADDSTMYYPINELNFSFCAFLFKEY